MMGKKAAVLASLCCLLVGCAAQNAYRRGSRLLDQGQFDAAVEHLQDAVRLKPDNPLYQSALVSAKGKAAGEHTQRAEERFEARDLAGAEREGEMAVRYGANEPTASQLLQRIREQIALAESRRKAALGFAKAQRFDEALAELEQATKLHRTLPTAQRDAQRIRDDGAAHYVALAQQHLSQGELSEAETAGRLAVRYVPSHAHAKQLLEEVAKRRRAAELVDQALLLLKESRYDETRKTLREAQGLHPQRDDMHALLRKTDTCECDDYIGRGNKAAAAGDLPAALRWYVKSKGIVNDYQDIDTLILKARRSLADQHSRRGAGAAGDARWGRALVEYLISQEFCPDDKTDKAIGECIKKISERIQYRVGVVGFHASDDKRPMGSAVETAVCQELLAAKPGSLSLMERPELKGILEEQHLSLTDMIDPRYRVEAGKLRGCDALVFGEIIGISVGTDRSHAMGTSRYEAGTQMVENPGYGLARMSRDVVARNVADIEADLAQSQQQYAELCGMPATPARNDYLSFLRRAIHEKQVRLQNARSALAAEEARLAGTPTHVQEPVVREHSYPIHTVTKTATLRVSVKMVDTVIGEVMLAEVTQGKASASDRTVQADPVHNVDGDPLDLPDDAAVTDKALQDAVATVRGSISRAVSQYWKRYSILADKALAAREDDSAVENFVNLLFACPSSTERTEQGFSALLKLVDHATDLVSLRQCLITRCKVLAHKPVQDAGGPKPAEPQSAQDPERQKREKAGSLATVRVRIPEYGRAWWPGKDANPNVWGVRVIVKRVSAPERVDEFKDTGPLFKKQGSGMEMYPVAWDFPIQSAKRLAAGDVFTVALPPGEYVFSFCIQNPQGGGAFGVVRDVNCTLDRRLRPGGHYDVEPAVSAQ